MVRVFLMMEIAYYYSLEGNKEKVRYHSLKALELSRKAQNNTVSQTALRKLVELNSDEKSREFFDEYVKIRNWLYDRELNTRGQFALVRYEVEKKDKENANLKLDNDLKQVKIESEQQQKIIFSLVGVIAIVILITYYSNRRKKLMYEAQLQKATAREEERQQIAKSLHDEVAGDLRMLHQKLSKTELQIEAKSVEKIKENVRNLSHQLSSVSFDEVSFKDQIINLIADNFSLDFRISTEGMDSVLWESVNATIKRTLYLCIRESLQNTLKYAEATKFFISFSSEKKENPITFER